MITTPLQHQSMAAYTHTYALTYSQFYKFYTEIWKLDAGNTTFMNGAGQGANFILRCLAYPYPIPLADHVSASVIRIANQSVDAQAGGKSVYAIQNTGSWDEWSPLTVEFNLESGIPSVYTTGDYALDFPMWYACSKHCSYKLFLPYIGYMEVDAFIGFITTLKIKYTIDVTTGIGVCYVNGYDTKREEYVPLIRKEFMAGMEIPITGADNSAITAAYRNASYANTTSAFGILGGVAMIGAGALSLYASKGLSTGQSIGMISAGAATLTGAAVAGDKAKEDMISLQNYSPNMTGISTDSGSALWSYHRIPYILCEHNHLFRGNSREKFFGYPCYQVVNIGDLTGYAEFNSVHIENTTATADEQAEIEQLLLTGVIING